MTPLDSRMTPMPEGTHASDDTLWRVLDAESLDVERDAVEHAAACAECQTRLGTMRLRRAQLSSLLDSVDVPAPALPDPARLIAVARTRARTRRLTPRRSLVVGALVLSGAALAAQPVGRWLVARWRAPSPEASPPTTSAPAPVAASPAAIAFVPQASELTISFDATPARGTLTVRRESGTQVRANVTAGARDEELVVLPGGLRIRNSAGSAANYVVVLPAAVERATVRIGSGQVSRTVNVRLGLGEARDVPLRP